MLPPSKPRLSSLELRDLLTPFNIDRKKYPVIVVGLRGYYKKSMGNTPGNDRGIYDDAIFIDSLSTTAAFNGNTDPSIGRPGIAVLVPTVKEPYLYKIGLHGVSGPNPYKALRQHGRVTVIRDGNNVPVTDKASAPFFINIHRGGFTTTSSLGCQTIHPNQWAAFISLVETEMKRNNQTVVPYFLIDG